jgi:hypothetical protein
LNTFNLCADDARYPTCTRPRRQQWQQQQRPFHKGGLAFEVLNPPEILNPSMQIDAEFLAQFSDD